MADTVNIGLRIPSIHPSDTDALRSFVLEAEAVGYHSIWVGDHVFYRVDVVDPMTMLTWVAAQTTRVRLGTAVMLTGLPKPRVAGQSGLLTGLSLRWTADAGRVYRRD